MTSTATIPPPLHRLENQPDNLITSSDANWLLNGAMDQEDTKTQNGTEKSNGETAVAATEKSNGETAVAATETPTVIPPLQPESKVIKNNKAVPW